MSSILNDRLLGEHEEAIGAIIERLEEIDRKLGELTTKRSPGRPRKNPTYQEETTASPDYGNGEFRQTK